MSEGSHPSTHPPLPPTTEDDRVLWLRLLRSRRVGISTFYRLIGEHGSIAAALDALPRVAREAGLNDYTPCPETVAVAEMRAARKARAQMICIGEAAYPAQLLDLADPPPILWAQGDPSLLTRPMIALVGARNASSLGGRMARALAADLGNKGHVVVSGLARGIDTAAHKASLATGTIAVMAGGVDVVYPSENTALAAEIEKSGLRLSEMPIGTIPQARHFPRRNRLISGLAGAVVLVEAAAKSGSLITAKCALDQGREVLAVPGHPFDARAAGCNMLIRDGARLVRDAADVIEALAPLAPAAPEQRQAEMPLVADIPPPPPEKRSLSDTAKLHRMILDRLGPSPLAEDQLIRDLGAPANTVAPVLVDLELDGRINRQSGGLLSLAETGPTQSARTPDRTAR
ncbi:DNA-protecting protein DprA [Aquicoccus porphyridii]|uniref:DNA-protecting protein DprA n=1 Tax=Aquicoccus porphyridii TaxID=1852029 RepID=A0A5A9Z5V9_9RHOB|nr:DNA-processing protein DprA [Aquicoccus porphyridii]KAA0912419.1 DNA-protecting protein DprA [Aquicoccus porphyridii]RAI53101.1 DNA-protecting protein DprA [Rhodobacteraceae bacterium AsT-22]